MNWVISIVRNLQLKRSTRFLLLFSICTIAVIGVVLACADSEDGTYSIFSPEAFVAKQYTPFFYDNESWYYKFNVETDDNNSRFNTEVVNDWDGYMNHQLSKPVLRYLLLHSTKGGVDSVERFVNGKIKSLKPDSLKINVAALDKNKVNTLFSYLKMAKDCEKFAVAQYQGWYDDTKPVRVVTPGTEKSLSTALATTKDPFVGQRLWFQLVRYYFFNDDTTSVKNTKAPFIVGKSKILPVFNKYGNTFPKNLTYYRALGYVAGYYRRKGQYALANYLYSRCYDYTFSMKIPSKFSFRVQEEDDWRETLKLAKNKEEKITLWHILGMEYDAPRAIREIVALDPKSDKIDVLLSRLVNTREDDDNRMYFTNHGYNDAAKDQTEKFVRTEIKLVDSVAQKNNTAKPYYWNIAAGYLHYLHHDYQLTGKFYASAEKQLPQNDKLVAAQYKMLVILLDMAKLKRIDAATEVKLVEPLNWLMDLHGGKTRIEHLRIADCAPIIAAVYKKQGGRFKANFFVDSTRYDDSAQVQRLVDFLNKPNKTPFEKTMVRYYPNTLNQLYYHQAAILAYRDQIDKAVLLMAKLSTMQGDTLPANPFNSRLNDCHDCDQAAHQKQKFTPLSFLKTMQALKTEMKAGNNQFRNAWLLANAFYNISYYGNSRFFYGTDTFVGIDNTDQSLAEKYYLLARKFAQTDEQRSRCTFMASKCEHNNYYTANGVTESGYGYSDSILMPPPGKYFAELKQQYAKTKYYQEVLHECGYFKSYVNGK